MATPLKKNKIWNYQWTVAAAKQSVLAWSLPNPANPCNMAGPIVCPIMGIWFVLLPSFPKQACSFSVCFNSHYSKHTYLLHVFEVSRVHRLHLINSFPVCFSSFFKIDPMRGPRKLEVVEVKSRQITIRWEPFGYNVTRCHSYNLTVHYCYQVGGQEQVREEVSWDTDNSHPQHTITNLSPYTNVSVKLILMNPEGRKESQELIVQTDEDRECFQVICLCEIRPFRMTSASLTLRAVCWEQGGRRDYFMELNMSCALTLKHWLEETERGLSFLYHSVSHHITHAYSSRLPHPCHPIHHPPLSLTVLSLTSLSVCFIPWPTEINQGNLCDLVFRATHWSLVGSTLDTQLKTAIYPSTKVFHSDSVYNPMSLLPSLTGYW